MYSFIGFTLSVIGLTAATAAASSYFSLGNIVIPYRRQHTDTFVAFSAGLTHNANLSTNATVVFDKVWTNTGNGYNNNTGIFTCPHAGVYVFIYHGLSENAGTMWLDIYKNSEYQITGYAHTTGDYASASNSILLSLVDGDQVYLRGHGTTLLYGRPDEVYATLTGFILIPNRGQGQGGN